MKKIIYTFFCSMLINLLTVTIKYSIGIRFAKFIINSGWELTFVSLFVSYMEVEGELKYIFPSLDVSKLHTVKIKL